MKGITTDDAIYIWRMIKDHGLPEDFNEFISNIDAQPEDAWIVLDEIDKFVFSHDWDDETANVE